MRGVPDFETDETGTLTTDVLIVGGGPAGLTAAIYLARFHLDVIVVDRGGSRASLIPKTRNHAGFPEGISGPDLIARMRAQAMRYGTRVIDAEVTVIRKVNDRFEAWAGPPISARAILLTTGVANNRPAMDEATHDAALAAGYLRYCPVCDGFEVTDQDVAVLGTGAHGAKEALFLRSFTKDVTLIAPAGAHELDAPLRQQLIDAGVRLRDGPAGEIVVRDSRIAIGTPEGRRAFDTLYPALGSRIHSELARPLGAEMSDDGCLMVDAHQRTDVPGLYAAGDVVFGLDQISHAMGEGGVAATTIRNDLAALTPLYR